MNVTPNAKLLDFLLAIQATDLDAGSLRLFQNDFTPDENSVLADFTVADFTGYANIAVATWNAPYVDDLGVPTILGGLRTFTQSGVVTTNTVYGLYYVSTGGDLVFSYRFDAPVIFAATGTVLNVIPKYQFANRAA